MIEKMTSLEEISLENLQANKIKDLLRKCELLAHENHLLRAENLELKPWKELVNSRLSPVLNDANQQLDLLWGYTKKMETTEHRIANFFQTNCSKFFLYKQTIKFFSYLLSLKN